MKKSFNKLTVFAIFVMTCGLAYAGKGAVSDKYRWMTFAVFGAIIAITMTVTYIAARSTSSASEFYAAGRSVSGFQNGWAIAGDYLSAASFLGIAGLIALYGYDGFMYSVGFLVAYITVLLVIAEPCRNIGKYTMGDILAFRNDPKKIKTVSAFTTIIISTFYMTAQMVGGGVLIKTLVGIDYEVSVVGVGILMLSYVVFGGMKATTWVQITKAVLLVTASVVLVSFIWAPYGFSLPGFLQDVVNSTNIQEQVARVLGDSASNMTMVELGQRYLEPGLYLKNPIDQISLGLALVLGTAGMPHILMRFFTVPTAKAARISVLWAMGIIGGFYVLTLFLGMGAGMFVGAVKIKAIDGGGNMAVPVLAQYLGGGQEAMMGNFFLAFVAAVSFATIVAVVAGLVLASASAMAHDIYVGVFRGEKASPKEQVIAARTSSVIVGIMAIAVGILAKGQNVAHLVALAFAVAASSNLPAIFLTMYWKKCNTYGIVSGMSIGALTAIFLVLISPNMTYPKLKVAMAEKVLNGEPAKPAQLARPAVGGYALTCELFDQDDCRRREPARPAMSARPAKPGTRDQLVILKQKLEAATDEDQRKALTLELAAVQRAHNTALGDLRKYEGKDTSIMGLERPVFLLKNPGIISIPLAFLIVFLVSFFTEDKRAEDMWEELYVRQNTGINAEAASEH